MKSSRFNTTYRKNSSKIHKKIGDILKESSLFSNYKIYQEYHVSKINSEYKSNREKFDWVILDLKLIIEAHGKQHYEFNNHFYKDMSEFIAQQERDELKRQAAIDAGFTYIVIKYNELKILNEDLIYNRMLENNNTVIKKEVEKPKRTNYNKQKVRDYRKQQYEKYKKWSKEKQNHDKDAEPCESTTKTFYKEIQKKRYK